ncbi:MAG: hypothetical protein NVS2B14_17950 [Chamaesiphon sp.]
MAIAGMWHGAAWGYIVWGILHGVALIVHRLTEAVSNLFKWTKYWWQSLIGVVTAWLLTQALVFTSWIFFRLPNLKQSNWVIHHLWNQSADIDFAQKIYGSAIGMGRTQLALFLAVLMVSMGIIYSIQRGLKLKLNWPLKLLLVPLCLFTVWVLAPQSDLPYIYFDF